MNTACGNTCGILVKLSVFSAVGLWSSKRPHRYHAPFGHPCRAAQGTGASDISDQGLDAVFRIRIHSLARPRPTSTVAKIMKPIAPCEVGRLR